MSNQHTLIALNWLMPVLQDVFDDLTHLLQQPSEQVNWIAVEQTLHQISGALVIAHQRPLASLSSILERTCVAIDKGILANRYQTDIMHSVSLLRYELQQLQQTQQLHLQWLIDRINFFKTALGEEILISHQTSDEQNTLLEQLQLPTAIRVLSETDNQDLVKLWRYYTLQLLTSNENQTNALHVLSLVASHLTQSQQNKDYQQVWQLVAIWLKNQALNEEPTPHDYAYLLDLLDGLMITRDLPPLVIGRFVVDILLQITQLKQKNEVTQALLSPLNLHDFSENKTLFQQTLGKLEEAIYQYHQPKIILPKLHDIKTLLMSHGWIFYQNQLEQLIADVQMMIDNPDMMDVLSWQVERQLQDLYGQLLEISNALENHIGYAQLNKNQATSEQDYLYKTRKNLENIKLIFNNYTQNNQVELLTVDDDLIEMTQVFDILGLHQSKEIVEKFLSLFNKISQYNINILSSEITNLLAETIACFELFLEYLSHQNVNHELLEQIQEQLNFAEILLDDLIDNPILMAQHSQNKFYQPNTLVYDDEGEKLINVEEITELNDIEEVFCQDDNHLQLIEPENIKADIIETPIQSVDNSHQQALAYARSQLKEDDYSMDDEIREIFIEEAEEVLTDMASQLPIWQADPEDLETLKEIRRGFHTLKGSGRMVGAFQLGETAWAVENMLNRVLNHTVEITKELVDFVLDTHDKLPILVEDFAKKQSPSIDPATIVLQANYFLQHELPEEIFVQPTIQAESPQVLETPFEQIIDKPIIIEDTKNNNIDSQQANQSISLPSVIIHELKHLKTVNDDIIDSDIQQIYVEEAQEVLAELIPNYDSWKNHLDNFNVLKEIHRSFHTLKGSGRMAGANQLGELAWAMENMLKQILDKKLEVSADVVALIGDVSYAFMDLIDIFAESRTDYPEKIRLWEATAHAYSHQAIAHQPTTSIHYQDIQSIIQTNQPLNLDKILSNFVDDSASMTSNITQKKIVGDEDLPTIIHEKILDNIQENNLTVTDLASLDLTAEVADSLEYKTSSDDDVIGHVFLEESQELLTKIDDFIRFNQDKEQIFVSDELVRAFHTLRGGAALSELPRVLMLSSALEDSLDELLRKEIPLNAKQLQVLVTAKDKLVSYIDDYKSHQPTSLQPTDEVYIAQLTQQLLEGLELDEQKNLTVTALMSLGIEDLLDADMNLKTEFAKDNEDVLTYVTTLIEQSEKFIEAVKNTKLIDLAVVLQQCYLLLLNHIQFSKDEKLTDALLNAHYHLTGILDEIAAGMNIICDEQIIQQLTDILAEKQFQIEMAAIEYETIDTDIELLDIFLEEATELEQSINKAFNQWQNYLKNIDALKELQRHLHTLTGGASMVGVQSISDLAYYAENLYQALATEQVANTVDIVEVMELVQETLFAQLRQIGLEHRSFYAKTMQEQLIQIIANGDIPAGMTLSVPRIVTAHLEKVDESEQSNIQNQVKEDNITLRFSQDTLNNFEQRRLETWHGHEPDSDILAVYLEEVKELIDSSSQNLQDFRNNTNNITVLQALQRELHTIKGGARMVGAEGLATLAHEMETIYEELGSHRKPATRMIGNLLASCHDWLASAVYVLENKFNPQKPDALILALQQFSKNPDSLKTIPQASLDNQIEQIKNYQSSLNAVQEGKPRDVSVVPSMLGNFEVEQEQNQLNAEMIRVSANLMEQMINLSSESAINRARIDMGVNSLTNTIEEMGITVQRLADQLRRMETELEVQILSQIDDDDLLQNVEFDPLEMDRYSSLNQLSKSLSESASDLLDIKTTMLDKTRDTENLLLQLSRTQNELQEGLMNSRTVPFSRITPRLQRIARQTATELNKSVELRFINDEDELDRNILDRITSPLEHMLRNAIDHGIERSEERIASSKAKTGLVTIELLREGGEIVIHLTDDGKGINVEAVRKKAIEQGLISADDTSLKPLDIMQYIFNAGLSTSASVTQISGRGVGMDVVQSEVKQLGGIVSVDSELGKGSRFTMRLPMTVTVSDALVVKANDKNFAIPLVQIERVVRVNTETVYAFHSSNQPTIEIDGQPYRMRYLNQILYGTDPLETIRQTSIPIIIIRNEMGQKLALQVDALAGSRIEVVVKPLGRQLSHIAGISAATIMGDGSVMLVLDLIALMRNATNIVKYEKAKANVITDDKHSVLIVDDSVTVRKVTSRLLERHGYVTYVAKDGVDALEKLKELTPDIILLDIEMPRMDGFEVANQIRHDSRIKDIPIIMITSRTGEKHRDRAMSLGVNEYMGKPFQEKELLDSITYQLANKILNA